MSKSTTKVVEDLQLKNKLDVTINKTLGINAPAEIQLFQLRERVHSITLNLEDLQRILLSLDSLEAKSRLLYASKENT